MAKQQNDKAKTKSRVDRWKELRKLWNQNVKGWVVLLEQLDFDKVTSAGERVKLCCPYHNDNNPSAEINLAKGYFRCYSGGCQRYEWDPIRFLSSPDHKVQRCASYSEALQLFKSHFHAKIAKAVVKEYEEDAAHRRRLRWVAECAQAKLDEAWAHPNNTEAAQNAVDWLKGRGIKDVSRHASLGLWPRLSDITAFVRGEGGTDEDLEHIKELFGQHFDIKYQDWVTFIYATDPVTPSAFKIRKPLTPAQEKALGDKQIHVLREKNGPMGAFGVLNPGYKDLLTNPAYQQAFVVEGEMDALSIYEQQEIHGSVTAVFLCLGGAGHNGADFLASTGINHVRIIGDDDEQEKKDAGEDGGLGFIDSVISRSYKVNCTAFVWPDDLVHPAGGKMDPDSAVHQFGFIPAYNAFLAEENYIYPHIWAFEQAQKKLNKVPPDDISSQTDITKGWAEKLHNEAERTAFLNRVHKDYEDVTPSDVKRALSQEEDTAEACVARIRNELMKRFHLHYYDGHSSKLSLWDPEDQITFIINPTRKDSIKQIAAKLEDGNILAWVRDHAGLPGYLPPLEGRDAVPAKWPQVMGQINMMMEEALVGLAKYAPSRPLALKGQGVHLDSLEEKNQGYLLSQYNMYHLEWNQEGSGLHKVTKLNGPSHGDEVFLVEKSQMASIGDWAKSIITCEADFFRPPKWNARQTLDHVFEIINTHWRFRHQVSDARTVALIPFYGYLLDAFVGKRVMLHLMGEAETGKSALLSLIAGALQLQQFCLCVNAHTEMDISVAALIQSHEGARMMVGVDEVNDPQDGSNQSQKVQQLYTALRGLAVQGYSRQGRGTPSHGAVYRELAFAAITASGTRIHDRMDDSRFKTIYMVRDPTLGSTQAKLARGYPAGFWDDLRHAIFYHSMHSAVSIVKRWRELNKKYADADSLPVASSRFKEGLYPLAAIAEEFGWDAHQYLYDFCDSRETEERASSYQTQGQDIFEAVLTMPKFPLDGEHDHRDVTLAEMLTNPTWRDNISSISGVCYDAPTKTLAVSWHAVHGYMSRFGNQFNAHRMHSAASSCRLYVDKSRAEKDGSIQRFRNSGIHGNRFDIFDVSEYVQKVSAGGSAGTDLEEVMADGIEIKDDEDLDFG